MGQRGGSKAHALQYGELSSKSSNVPKTTSQTTNITQTKNWNLSRSAVAQADMRGGGPPVAWDAGAVDSNSAAAPKAAAASSAAPSSKADAAPKADATPKVDITPKPVQVQALPDGAQTTGQAAHMKVQQTNQEQVNAMQGGAHALSPAGITCPQSPMSGMSPSPNDSNAQSCQANGTRAQGIENAVGDASVGKVATGGSRRRRKRRTKPRRKTRRRRRTKHRRHKKKRTTRRRRRIRHKQRRR